MVVDAPLKGGSITSDRDSRITPIGAIARKFKVDELPQLVNVLKGDMSLVGPRPEMPEFVRQFEPDYRVILQIRPGITDLASLKYHNESEVLAQFENPSEAYIRCILPDKLSLAKEYLNRSSLLFDIELILRTLLKLTHVGCRIGTVAEADHCANRRVGDLASCHFLRRSMKPRLILVVMAFLLPCAAQDNETSAQPNIEQAPAPPTLAGQDIPRGLPLEGAGPNYVAGGISITQMYTDNADLTNSNRLSDLSWDFSPHLALVHSSTRLAYDLDAMAGFVVNRKLNDRNQATETGAADLSYRMTQFVTLRLSDSFTNTTGLWSGLSPGTGTSGSGIGPLQQQNSSVFTYNQFRSNAALGELSGTA